MHGTEVLLLLVIFFSADFAIGRKQRECTKGAPEVISRPPRTSPKVIPKPPRRAPKVVPKPPRRAPKVIPKPPRRAPKVVPKPPRRAPGSVPKPPRKAPKVDPRPPRRAPKVIPRPPRKAPKVDPRPPRRAPKVIPKPPRRAPKVIPKPLPSYVWYDDGIKLTFENAFGSGDVDECALGTDNCDTNANCTNTNGGFNCSCNTGYTGNGTTCTDINECALGTDSCSVLADCSNNVGSYTCQCKVGSQGNGVTCNALQCIAMTNPNNGFVRCSNSNFWNSRCNYFCNPGFDRLGSSFIICDIPSNTGTSASWNTIPPTCNAAIPAAGTTGCLTDADCTAGICRGGQCTTGCQRDLDCAQGETCLINGRSGRCSTVTQNTGGVAAITSAITNLLSNLFGGFNFG